MGMRLQDAIDFASNPANGQAFGLDTDVVVTMHDQTDTVLVGTVSSNLIFTFRPDVPLRNWGTGTIGQPGSGDSDPIDVSVRRDPGFQFLRFLGLGPSVQIEIDKLTALGGTATNGVTLQATEYGPLLRAIGPSLRDPATIASYTVTLRGETCCNS